MQFNQPYNREKFLGFIQTKLCPSFVKKIESYSFSKKSYYFDDKHIYKLWDFTLKNDEVEKNITVFEIKQRSVNDPRVTLTKDAFKLLEEHWEDTALIIFRSTDSKTYRLSLLTMQYSRDGKKTSNAKRFSFLLWEWEKTKTPEHYLDKPLTNYTDLKNRFDVEVVRKDFFEKYLELYMKLYKEIQRDKKFTEMLTSQQVDVVSFTKNLLGKIVFLYFIQQKGRLGLGRKEKVYGKWDKDFMRVMRNNFKNSNESMSTEKTWYFYNDYLERLFFAWLNQDRRDNDDRFPNLKMKVPYLNGWLFKEDYEWREWFVAKINNDVFSNIDSKWEEANGILDIFDRYNFTVDEDSLYDSDMAVDPEMLGRIFEKMISISSENIDEIMKIFDEKWKKTKIDFGKKLNKQLGAFYTPREIVHYMTKESLIAYIINNIKWNKEENEQQVRNLFEIKEQFLLNTDDLKSVWLSEDIFDKLWGLVEDIDIALKKVKILDPAIWSGAFPMGLLHEISSIRYYIYGVFFKEFEKDVSEYKVDWKISMYKIKKEIIWQNIYGVDIDAWAIDIARLRFWLSLIVDEQTPEPLPNFEFKFICANTLMPLDVAKEQDLFAIKDAPKLETLKRYMRDYYNTDKKKEKADLRERIRKYTNIKDGLFSNPSKRVLQIAEFGDNFDNTTHSHSFFDPSLMMSEWSGFDIVIGNPPYWVSIKWEYRKQLEKHFDKVPDYEIYYYFIELAHKLLKEGWVKSYIIPNAVLFNVFAEKYRSKLLKEWWIEEILDCTNFEIFESATVRNIVTLFLKNKSSKYIWYRDTENTLNFGDLIKKDKNNIEVCNLNQRNRWASFKSNIKFNFNGILNWCLKLEEICTITFGLQTKNKKIYVSDIYEGEERDSCYTWKDISKYFLQKHSLYFKNRPKEVKAWGSWNMEYHKSKKIVVRQIGWPEPIFAYDDIGCASLNTMYNIVLFNKSFDIKYILSIVNSAFIKFYRYANFIEGLDLFPKIKWYQLKTVPIKEISLEKQKSFIKKVDQILGITEKSNYNPKNPPTEQKRVEKEIDEIVYKLYGLTDEEIKVIEESIK